MRPSNHRTHKGHRPKQLQNSIQKQANRRTKNSGSLWALDSFPDSFLRIFVFSNNMLKTGNLEFSSSKEREKNSLLSLL